jgi:hypothetical protein
MEKQCTKCKITKNLESFHKKKTGMLGCDSKCKECKNYSQKEYRSISKDKKAAYQKEYRQKNKDHIRNYSKDYRTVRKKKDPLYRAILNMRSRLSVFVKSVHINKNDSTKQLIGCSIAHLKNHLEEQFLPGMSWSNYGDWHIDHKIPLSSAKSEKALVLLSHYSNLQPLWAIDNLSKGCH